jgi:hypothetical protein
MPDFVFADTEFDRQATTLDTLIETIDVSALQDGVKRHQIEGVSLPIVPSGGQNTMAAAAIVLLAAHFEEYVRQQIEEYAKAIITEYAHFDEDFKSRFIDSYWRSGTARLAAIRPKGYSSWMDDAAALLRRLVEYPVIGNVLEFRSEYICTHDNNMRWDTVRELAGRVGVKSLADLMFKSKRLKDILDNPRKDRFSPTIERKMNSFYDLRNGIVHSISHNSGVGATIFKAWSEFFRIFTTAFASSLEASFKLFEIGIEARKTSAANVLV